MTIATIAHRQFRSSAGTDPRAQANAQTEAQPAAAPQAATKPSMPKFSAAEGIARAAVRAYTACTTFIKDLTMKAFSLIAGRSDARTPRATAGVFNAQRAAANPVQGESVPLLSRAPEMGAVKLRGDSDTVILSRTPEMGGVKWRDDPAAATTSRVSTRTGSTVGGDAQTAASARKSKASVKSMSVQTETNAAVPVSTASVAVLRTPQPEKVMVSSGAQTDSVDEPARKTSTAHMESQTDDDSGIDSGPESPASPSTKSLGGAPAFAAPATVRGGPPTPPPPPSAAMLRDEDKRAAMALKIKVKVRETADAPLAPSTKAGSSKDVAGKNGGVGSLASDAASKAASFTETLAEKEAAAAAVPTSGVVKGTVPAKKNVGALESALADRAAQIRARWAARIAQEA